MKSPWLWLALAAALLSGCTIKTNRHSTTHNATTSLRGQSQWPRDGQMVLHYTNCNGKAVLSNDHVTLVFNDISRAQQQAFHFKENKQAIQVSGGGSTSVDVSCRRNLAFLRFHSDYANGTNTVQFGNHTVRFAEAGQLLLVGSDAIPLGTNGHKRVRITNRGAILE